MTTPRKTSPRKPYVKPTNAELALRVETVARLLGDRQATKTEVHQYCRDQWGVHWMTANRYMIRARAFLLERAGKTRDVVLAEAVIFNEGLLRSDKATTREKQDARRELNELYAVYPPRRTEISGPEGEPIAIRKEISPVLRDRLQHAFREKIRRDVRREERENRPKPVETTETAETKGHNAPSQVPPSKLQVTPPKRDVLL